MYHGETSFQPGLAESYYIFNMPKIIIEKQYNIIVKFKNCQIIMAQADTLRRAKSIAKSNLIKKAKEVLSR